MNRFAVWTLACRPQTLVASSAPALVGTALSLREGFFNPLIFILTLLTGMLIQIGINFTNDYCDFVKGADTEERKGFLRVTQAGLIDPSTLKRAILSVFVLALSAGGYLIITGGVSIALLLSFYILLGVLYTAGPMPLGYIGLGDVLVLLFFGPGAVLITYFLQTHTLSWDAVFAGLSLGALSTGILVINNIRDLEEDDKAGKKTLIVRWGRLFGKIEFCSLILLAYLLTIPLLLSSAYSALIFLSFPKALWVARSVWKNTNPFVLNPLFENMGKLLWVFTFLLSVGLLL